MCPQVYRTQSVGFSKHIVHSLFALSIDSADFLPSVEKPVGAGAGRWRSGSFRAAVDAAGGWKGDSGYIVELMSEVNEDEARCGGTAGGECSAAGAAENVALEPLWRPW